MDKWRVGAKRAGHLVSATEEFRNDTCWWRRAPEAFRAPPSPRTWGGTLAAYLVTAGLSAPGSFAWHPRRFSKRGYDFLRRCGARGRGATLGERFLEGSRPSRRCEKMSIGGSL